MSHEHGHRLEYTPEQIDRGLRTLAQRTGYWWPDDKTIAANAFAWLAEVILRERQYFDRMFGQRGGITPCESFARVQFYEPAIREATPEQLAALLRAIAREEARTIDFHALVERQLDARRGTASRAERSRQKHKNAIRRLRMSKQRHEFCAALLTTFRTLADQHIASSVTEATASVDAAALPTPRDHNSQVSAVSIRPAPEATDGRQSRKQA
ncbi:MAG: hypothetical protein IT290_05115 [Deltaproteobacteria bacterium]|nr:hypothetical protein [Deltaproteobacteria bacterium]